MTTPRRAVEDAIKQLAEKIGEACAMGKPGEAVEYAEALESTTDALANLARAEYDE